MPRPFRFAVKVPKRGRKGEEFVDTGSNDRPYAEAVLSDLSRAFGMGTCTLVKAFVPWDSKQIPEHIIDIAGHRPTQQLIELLDTDPNDPEYVDTAIGRVHWDDLDTDPKDIATYPAMKGKP